MKLVLFCNLQEKRTTTNLKLQPQNEPPHISVPWHCSPWQSSGNGYVLGTIETSVVNSSWPSIPMGQSRRARRRADAVVRGGLGGPLYATCTKNAAHVCIGEPLLRRHVQDVPLPLDSTENVSSGHCVVGEMLIVVVSVVLVDVLLQGVNGRRRLFLLLLLLRRRESGKRRRRLLDEVAGECECAR